MCTEIYTRDCAWLSASDLVIAECSSASLGVGYELCYAEKLNKPTLVLYNETQPKRLSGMIAGHDDYFEVALYKDVEGAKQAITAFIEKHRDNVTKAAATTATTFSPALTQAIAALDSI